MHFPHFQKIHVLKKTRLGIYRRETSQRLPSFEIDGKHKEDQQLKEATNDSRTATKPLASSWFS